MRMMKKRGSAEDFEECSIRQFEKEKAPVSEIDRRRKKIYQNKQNSGQLRN